MAFVSRVAKNFQDYYINVITQRLGAQLYSDGIRHSLELPVLGLRGSAQRRDARPAAESPHRRREAHLDLDQRAVHVARRHHLRDDLRVQRPLADRAGVFPDRPAARLLSSVLSRRIKQIQKVIVAETTALAGSTTESLRNIELVKSLGLGQQEIARLNGTTRKILKLELKKVNYLRSLSFIQGTAVNFLRTSIMFLMLYLIYTRAITVGQFFSLFIYSFFIFGPLQELGNIINIYRETEASLNVYEEILRDPEGAEAGKPGAAATPCERSDSSASASSTSRHRLPPSAIFRFGWSVGRPLPSSGRRARGRRRW